MITAPRRPAPKAKVGSRSRRVPPPRRSFVDRNRSRLLWAGVAVVVAVGSLFVFLSFNQKGYACLSLWTPPSPAPTTAPSATPRIGYFQDDMGHNHTLTIPETVKYTFCPPASGTHYNQAGVAGPIPAKVYGPNEKTVPQNWIHNLEHGALVLLYRCGSGDTCDDAQQAALKAYYSAFPNSPICHFPPGQIGPVFTRFDDMAFPYAALVWDMVLPLDTLDTATINAFWAQNGERTNRERICIYPSPSPGPTDTPGPTGTVAPSSPPSSPPSTAPSTAPGSPAPSSPGPSST